MQDTIRREVFETCQTVIVKIGTNVLTTESDRLNLPRIQCLADQIHRIQETGRRVVLVSSGAVGAGIGILGLNRRPESLPELQAAAAIGQPSLMRTWDDALGRMGHRTAQLLLTGNDFRNRQRYLNVRNTLRTLFDFRVIPIVNENDTVSIREIAVGDNDQLACMLTTLLTEPLLVILSGIEGLYDGPPSQSASRVISVVEKPDESLLRLVANEQSTRGRGGMGSKLRAILSATGMGETVILASGRSDTVLDDIRLGNSTGTLFLSRGESVPAWKRWIGFGARRRNAHSGRRCGPRGDAVRPFAAGGRHSGSAGGVRAGCIDWHEGPRRHGDRAGPCQLFGGRNSADSGPAIGSDRGSTRSCPLQRSGASR
jgi:glutamate 5-kinase